MKTTYITQVFLVTIACVCLASSGWSDESPAAKNDGATLADFDKAREAIPEAARSLFATIQAETDSGHLNKKDAAAELRRADDLRYVTTSARVDRWLVEQVVQKNLAKPPTNAAILQAWKDLNARLQASDTLYAQKYPVMVAEAVKTAANVWRTAREPEEIRPTIQDLKALEAMHWPWVGLDRQQINTPNLTPLAEYLESYAALLAAEKMGDPELLAKAAASLSANESPFGTLISVKELDDRRHRSVDNSWVAAWEEMLTTLPKATKPEDLEAITNKLDKVARATNFEYAPARAQAQAQTYARYYGGKEMAMAWGEMLRHELAGEWDEAARKAVELNKKAKDLAPTLVAPIEVHLATEQQQAMQTGKKRHEDLLRKVRQVLAAVTFPADLQAVIDDPNFTPGQAGSGDASDLAALRGHLRWLYSVWAMTEIDMTPSPAFIATGSGFHHPWTTETGKIWSKVQEKILARALKTVAAVPLSANATPAANVGPDLVSAAEARHDWRRAFRLVRFLNTLNASVAGSDAAASGGAEKEHLAAMRSLLVGDNFAKAEMWPNAIRSYQAALSFVADPLLSAEVADRLKSLKTRHPESF